MLCITRGAEHRLYSAGSREPGSHIWPETGSLRLSPACDRTVTVRRLMGAAEGGGVRSDAGGRRGTSSSGNQQGDRQTYRTISRRVTAPIGPLTHLPPPPRQQAVHDTCFRTEPPDRRRLRLEERS